MDLKPLINHLESLARNKPNANARAQVRQALYSKWDGVRVAATKTLCVWGDPKSLTQAKAALAELASKQARWANAGAMAQTLAPHLRAEDTEWVIEVLGKSSHVDNVLGMRVLADNVPTGKLLKGLAAAVDAATTASRRAAVLQVIKYAQNRHAQRET